MSEIHNLQIVLTQMPRVTKVDNSQAVANGGQIINVVNQEKREIKLKQVSELSESEETEKEDPQKRKVKKNPRFQKLDIYT